MADKTEAMEHVIHSSMPIDFERRYAMDNLIAQDADLIDVASKVTEADRDAAKHFWQKSFEGDFYTLPQAFARHRKYGYDQGYYDGRKMDAMEERAKIVAWLWGMGLHNINDIADAIEVGEHLK